MYDAWNHWALRKNQTVKNLVKVCPAQSQIKAYAQLKIGFPFVGVWAWKFGRKNKVFIVILKIHISITVNGNWAKTFECCNFWLFGGLLWCLVFFVLYVYMVRFFWNTTELNKYCFIFGFVIDDQIIITIKA